MFLWKWRGVRSKWLFSYALVLLIPIIMMAATYVQTRRVLEDEIQRANSALLSQLQREIDSTVNKTYQLAEMISMNPKIAALINSQNEIGWQERLLFVQAVADFKQYYTNRDVSHFYIYFTEGDFILGDSSYYDTRMYDELFLAPAGIRLEDWKSFMLREHRGGFTSLESFSSGTKKGMMYTQTLPIQQRGASVRATLVIELDEEQLMASIANIQSYNKGRVYILDSENRPLASSEHEETAYRDFRQLKLVKDRGTLEERWDGEDLILSYIESHQTNWKYIYVLPKKLYSQKAEYVKKMTVMTIALALTGGSILAVLMVRRNYHPLKRLIRSVGGNKRETPGLQANDEYDYLEEAIETALDRNNLMNRTIENQKKALRSNLLVRLLKGRIQKGIPIEEVLPEYGIRPQSGEFVVMLFYLEDYSGFFRQDEQDEEKKREFVHLIMTNIIEELAGKEHQGWMTEIDDMLACLINLNHNTSRETAEQTLSMIAEEAQQFLRHRFRIIVTISIGSIRRSVPEIPAAYQDALTAMEYRMLDGQQAIIWYEKLKYQEGSYSYSMEKEQQLINYVNAGDFAGARNTLDEIIQSNVGQENISVDLIRCLMFDICSTMMKAAMETNLESSELYEENLEAIRELMSGSTVSAMRERMTAFLYKLCSHSTSRKRLTKFKLIDKVLLFIAENYRDCNLSITLISGHFGVHPSYLSRSFKDQAGDTLTEYINKYRVEQSKLLLRQEHIYVKDISDMVGFGNINTFIRLFKKYEGVTPSVFREAAHMKEEPH